MKTMYFEGLAIASTSMGFAFAVGVLLNLTKSASDVALASIALELFGIANFLAAMLLRYDKIRCDTKSSDEKGLGRGR